METVIGQNFVLGGKIGQGAFGEIYEGILPLKFGRNK